MPVYQPQQTYTPYPPPQSSGGDFGFQTREADPDPPRRRRRNNRGNGTVALVLGLLSMFLFPLLGPVAIIVAKGALRDDPDDGWAKAGLVLGWFITALLIFAFCGCIFVLGFVGLGGGR